MDNQFALLNPGGTAWTLFLVMLKSLWGWAGAVSGAGTCKEPSPALTPAQLTFSCCPRMWLLEL